MFVSLLAFFLVLVSSFFANKPPTRRNVTFTVARQSASHTPTTRQRPSLVSKRFPPSHVVMRC
eukprot:m.342737 g.342737  ORF g.342737 m.342737 type:complete len:63 (-) comp19846_c0_seq21:902-1090(-)